MSLQERLFPTALRRLEDLVIEIPDLTQWEIDNREIRSLGVITIDTSGSMDGMPLQETDAGLTHIVGQLKENPVSSVRAELAVCTFGGRVDVSPFCPITQYEAPVLVSGGRTPMAEAVIESLSAIQGRRHAYQNAGIDLHRSLMVLITDGGSTSEQEDMELAGAYVRQMEESGEAACLFVGTSSANFRTLEYLSVRTPLRLQDGKYRELMAWCGSSLEIISQSSVGSRPRLTTGSEWRVM